MQLEHLSTATTTISVSWMGETADVEVRPGALTRAVLEDLANTSDPKAVCRGVMAFVASWDILDGGERLPVTEEVIARLPVRFVDRILLETYKSVRAEGKA